MPIRTRFLRRLAWGLVVTGLVIGEAGDILLIDNEILRGDLPVAQDHLWRWQALEIGTAMAGLGLLLLVLLSLYARLLRRRILAEPVKSTRDGFGEGTND